MAAKAEGKAPKENGANDSILAGISRSLPAALEANQLTSRAARIGFDWDHLEGIFDKIDEEKREILAAVGKEGKPVGAQEAAAATGGAHARIEEEAGDLLFAAVNVARFLGVDPEIALKKANRKFKERFQSMEVAARREGRPLADLPRLRMEELWDESKLKKPQSA